MFLDAQYKQLVKNFKEQDGTKEFKAVVKWFNPAGVGTWYLSELNPDTNEAFGLTDLHEKELGYVSINELKEFNEEKEYLRKVLKRNNKNYEN